jgi:hypothetical protein
MEYGVVGNAVAGISNGSSMDVMSNAYYNAGWKYANSSRPALRASLNGDVSGAFTWNIAPSGTAGNAISFTQAMTLDASGNLLLSCTSQPSASVTGGAYGYGSGVDGYWSNSVSSTSARYQYAFYNPNGLVGTISTSGSVTSYNVTSDQRLKTNVVDAPSGNIDNIKVRSFDWIADGSHQEYGMVAQELIEVAPYAVYQPENPEEMMAVDYSKLVPMMIKEIQDLKQRISTLENK